MDTDQELMRRLGEGDQIALASLYERYNSVLYSVARRIMGESASAEEVLQDTFFQLWQKAAQFDSARGSLIGWLLTMVRHRAISRVRRKDDRFYSEPLGDNLAGRHNAGSTILEQQIARELVCAAMAGLPKVQLEAITLAYFDGLTCEEIAVRTQAPVGTIKGRLRSALKAMKGTLDNPRRGRLPIAARRTITLEDILITEQLFSRTCRPRSLQEEADSLRILARVVTAAPEQLIDSFLRLAIDLCCAGTAGLSLLEKDAKASEVFRWTNLAGKLETHVGGATPRGFSPCGVTLDRNAPQLFSYPGRYFHYFNDVEIPIVEGLVIPFRVGEKTEGTVWIISHEKGSIFDSEDVRIMTSLTEFTGCAVHLMRSIPDRGHLPCSAHLAD